MTKQLTNSFAKLALLSTILACVLTVNYIQAAWSNPTAAPTGGNIAAPLNTGSVNQIKTGALTLDGLSLTANQSISGASPMIHFNDTSAGAYDFWTHVNSNRFYILRDSNNDGSWDGSHPLYLDGAAGYATFENQVRANTYCDRSGGNCTSAANLGGGGVGDGQKWYDYTGSRSTNVVYRNTTGKPILFSYQRGTVDGFNDIYVSENNSTWVRVSSCWRGNSCSGIIIPNNYWYKVTGNNYVRVWAELR